MSLAPYALTDLRGVLDALSVSSVPNPGGVEEMINSASRQIIMYAQREFIPLDATDLVRTFPLLGQSAYFAPSEPQTVTTVRIVRDSLANTVLATDYQLDHYEEVGSGYRRLTLLNPAMTGWGRGQAMVEVTGTWGWTFVPPEIKSACEFQVVQWTRRNLQARGDMLANDSSEISVSPYVGLSYSLQKFLDQQYGIRVFV